MLRNTRACGSVIISLRFARRRRNVPIQLVKGGPRPRPGGGAADAGGGGLLGEETSMYVLMRWHRRTKESGGGVGGGGGGGGSGISACLFPTYLPTE